jgi:hypothetical protein
MLQNAHTWESYTQSAEGVGSKKWRGPKLNFFHQFHFNTTVLLFWILRWQFFDCFHVKTAFLKICLPSKCPQMRRFAYRFLKNFRGLRTPYCWELCSQTPVKGWSLSAQLPEGRRGEGKWERAEGRGWCQARRQGRFGGTRGPPTQQHFETNFLIFASLRSWLISWFSTLGLLPSSELTSTVE